VNSKRVIDNGLRRAIASHSMPIYKPYDNKYQKDNCAEYAFNQLTVISCFQRIYYSNNANSKHKKAY